MVYLIIIFTGYILISVLSFIVGKKANRHPIAPSTTELQGRLEAMERSMNDKDKTILTQIEEIKQLTTQREVYKAKASDLALLLQQKQTDCDQQLTQLKELYEKQMTQQLQTLREMNQKQVETQLNLIREQMKSTSESVLKARQNELNEYNQEQVGKIIDPLQRSLKEMEEAFCKNKEQQKDALTRLDESIQQSMKQSASLGETADRLTRALTGEVKIQGNFGELKLKQLFEDLALKEGEQYDTQETLRDRFGKALKGDDGKGLIPDFILHFPNNRHVVVDSKMSLTDFEQYMNAPEGSDERNEHLKAHINSVRMQVKRLAKKEYSKYLPEGYNRLNFAIMYVPIEAALNLALLNDATLWREAYDEGVLILGPQTMYMNLRVLEMMWTQVRQLNNQQAMIDAANLIIERVQEFGKRYLDVESSMHDVIKKMDSLKIITADRGVSIITAAKKLVTAGAKESNKKKKLDDLENRIFIDNNTSDMLSTE